MIGGCLEKVCYVCLSLHVLVAMDSWRAEHCRCQAGNLEYVHQLVGSVEEDPIGLLVTSIILMRAEFSA